MSKHRSDIAQRVPHAGDMVLLDEVLTYDDTRITCRARTGAPADHPLSRKGKLPATALAGYGAQAMAVHGSLLAATDAPPREGRLVALPELSLAVSGLEHDAELTVRAERIGGSVVGEVYRFEVSEGEQLLAQGRATVMFPNPEEAA